MIKRVGIMKLEDELENVVDVMSVKCDAGKLYAVIIDTFFDTARVDFYFQRKDRRKKEKLNYSMKFTGDPVFRAKMYLRGNLYDFTMNYCKKLGSKKREYIPYYRKQRHNDENKKE